MQLTPKHKRALERAKKSKYLKFSTGKTDALENTFYKWCKENGYPLIKVIMGHKYADINIDMVTTELTLSDDLQDDYQSLYNSYRDKNVPLKSTPQVCYFEKIPIEVVDELLQKIMSFLPFIEV
jgi:hypothetical protein